jgi:hypothetical protein
MNIRNDLTNNKRFNELHNAHKSSPIEVKVRRLELIGERLGVTHERHTRFVGVIDHGVQIV